MRILITAGGTRAPIDEVRWIGNVSTGRFGSQLALEALSAGAEVVHLHARGAEMPFERTIDLAGDWRAQVDAIRRDADLASQLKDRYRAIIFTEVREYARLLEHVLRDEPMDIVYLAAAVSDFEPEERIGKISSRQPEIDLRLFPVPKLIARVKDWAPDVYQVGFKLLAGASDEALIEAARESGRVNRSDVTVANDLRTLRQGQHTIYLVRDGHPVERYQPVDLPARRLIERTFQWCRENRR